MKRCPAGGGSGSGSGNSNSNRAAENPAAAAAFLPATSPRLAALSLPSLGLPGATPPPRRAEQLSPGAGGGARAAGVGEGRAGARRAQDSRGPGGACRGARRARRGAVRRGPSPCSLARAGRAAPLRAPRARAMSAFCLGLAGRASAPAEPDSACCMELPTAATDTVGSPAAAAQVSFPGGPGELELALEEELALLAAGERPSDLGEQPPAEPGPLAEEAGLLPLPAQDPELLSVIRQKEKDLVLAARLGKALLEKNQDMSRQYEQMHKELTDKLEVSSSPSGCVGSGEPRHPPGPGQLLEPLTQCTPPLLTLPHRKPPGSVGVGWRVSGYQTRASIECTDFATLFTTNGSMHAVDRSYMDGTQHLQ